MPDVIENKEALGSPCVRARSPGLRSFAPACLCDWTRRCGASLTTSEPEAEEDSAPVRVSYGWKFIFVVFVVFGLYLGLGVAYNVKRNGASGLDAVPHLEMWKDLPFAVRDGIIFSIDTIKSKGRQQYQTYL